MTDTNAPPDSQKVDRIPTAFRISVAIPDTATARGHHALLIRTAQEVGQRTLAVACGHDASWVCRVLQGEGRANIAEWLAWMDSADIRMSRADARANVDQELLSVLLRKTASTVEDRLAGDMEESVTITGDEYRALLTMSRKAIACMQDELG